MDPEEQERQAREEYERRVAAADQAYGGDSAFDRSRRADAEARASQEMANQREAAARDRLSYGGSQGYFQGMQQGLGGLAAQRGAEFGEDRAAAARARGDQQALAQALRAQAMGMGGPSAAEAQLRQGMDQAARQNMAMARSGRGNQMLGMRNAMQSGDQMALQANQAAAALRAQEQLAAQQGLGQLLAGMRGQDLASQQMGMGGQLGALSQLHGVNMGQLQTANQGADRDQAASQFQQQMDFQRDQQMMNFLGGILQGGASAAAMLSDERSKQEIAEGDEPVKALLAGLSAREYEYRPEVSQRPGRHVGIMAQDLAKSEAGRALLGRDEQTGYMTIDVRRGLGASLAGLANVNKRLSALEED